MDVRLVMIGIILGAGLLTVIGCYFYWYEEDKKLDREAAYTIAYVKNLLTQEWCLDSIDRALDDALFWNSLSQCYLDAGFLYEARKCYSMSYDILEGITGRSNKPSHYIPRGSKMG